MALAPAKKRNPLDAIAKFADTIFGTLYVGGPLLFLIWIRFTDSTVGFHWIFLLFVIIWAGDSLAYFVGRAVGRHLLAPRISPKKTWEGAMAGFAGSIGAAGAYAHWVWESPDLAAVLVLAGLIAIAGQIGDLAESAMKRGAGVKDSGGILPGHGGVLDRIDALLFGSAALWLALSLKDLGIW
jgi:phosphatidate cytidylyltransferase